MKLNSITLVNFLNHRNTTVDLSRPINVFLGANASGKSAILDAIEFGLLGTARCTDLGGKGAADLIGPHGKSAHVTIIVDGVDIYREISETGSSLRVGDQLGTMKVLQDSIHQMVGPADRVRAVIQASRLLDFPAAAQQAILQGLVDPRIPVEDLLAALEAGGATADDLAIVRQRLGSVPQAQTAEDLKRMHKAMYDARTQAGQDKARLEPKGDPRIERPDLVPQKLTRIREDVQVLEAEERGLAEAVSAEDRRRGKLDQLQARLQELRDQNFRDPEALERELAEARAAYREAEASVKKAREQWQITSAKRAALEAEQAKLDAERALIESGTCPTCTRGWDKNYRETRLGEIVNRRKKITTELKALGGVADQWRDDLDPGAVRAAEQALERTVAAIRDRDAEVERAQATMRDLAEGQDVDRTRLQEVRDQLALLRPRLTELERQDAVLQAAAEQSNGYAAACARHESLDRLVRLLSPKQVPAQLAARQLAPLVDRINERFSVVTNQSLRLSVEASDRGLELSVLTGGRAVRPSNLSESERIRLGVCIAEAVSAISGVGLLVVDRADTMRGDNQGYLFSMLEQVSPDHSNILVMATSEEPEAGSDGVFGMWMVEDGNVRLLEAVAV